MKYEWLTAAAFPLLAIAGCGETRGARPPTPDQIPATIAIEGTPFVSGFKTGVRRENRVAPAFRIARRPVTVAQYRACVEASACTAPEVTEGDCGRPMEGALTGATYTSLDELPVTCASPAQAADYCKWLSGELPTWDEWLVAARGMEPHAYAWGDSEPTCKQHPRALKDRAHYCAQGGSDLALFAVAKRAEAASPAGLEDVLLTPAELLRVTPDAQFSACLGKEGACVVTGTRAGSIDSLARAPRDAAERAGARDFPTYGFRCVWEGGT